MSAHGGDAKLSELYQEVILDHNRNPRHWGELPGARHSHGVNPLCGDDYHVYVQMTPGGVKEVRFKGSGCAISKASADLMAGAVENKSVHDARALADNFIRLLTDSSVSEETRAGVGKLKFFEGVKNFPVRVKCATLAWRALEAVLNDDSNAKITTEE